jgi:hypothetical protein
VPCFTPTSQCCQPMMQGRSSLLGASPKV